MNTWQIVFRAGVAPNLSTAALLALRDGLHRDDPDIIQNSTTFPPPLACLAAHEIERACPLGYALWKAERLETVGQLEEAFALLCQRVQETLGEPAAIRYFLNHVDESDRPAMLRELLAEVAWALAQRPGKAGAA